MSCHNVWAVAIDQGYFSLPNRLGKATRGTIRPHIPLVPSPRPCLEGGGSCRSGQNQLAVFLYTGALINVKKVISRSCPRLCMGV